MVVFYFGLFTNAKNPPRQLLSSFQFWVPKKKKKKKTTTTTKDLGHLGVFGECFQITIFSF